MENPQNTSNGECSSMSKMFTKETREALGFEKFPFNSELSFVPLINFWKKQVNNPDAGISHTAKIIIKELDSALEFLAPIRDQSLLEKHKGFVDLLMSGLFPPALRNTQLARASAPFNMQGFFHTPATINLTQKCNLHFCVEKSSAMAHAGTVIKACSMILNQFYGQQIAIEPTMIFTAVMENGLQKHYKTSLNLDFVEIKKLKPLKGINQTQINQLLSNIYDLEMWMAYIPPENFEFHGMVTVQLIDITDEETLSRLKRRLLEKDAIVSSDNIRELERLLRNYFALPGLRLGLTALDYPLENAVAHKYKIKYNFLADRHDHLLDPAFRNSFYEQACKYGESITIENLESAYSVTPLEKSLLEEGIKSLIISPLKNKDNQIIGLLEVGSHIPYDMNSFFLVKLQEIIPLFRTALERSREEIDNAIEVIIREQYTALHPSVDWKFMENAFDLLGKREKEGDSASVDPIVFKDVIPLYGQADIVGSSSKRNESIKADLIDNLEQIANVLKVILTKMDFPIVGQYIYRCRKEIQKLREGISSNDEFRIMDFIHSQIHPLFQQFRNRHTDIEEVVQAYFEYIDSDLGIVYRQRRDYEDSVTAINDLIGSFLEQRQREAQKILPHYFEKYKTDGVEYNIYIGESLLKQEKFYDFHLKNLRLWELITMCQITRKVEELSTRLPMPLSTAQLILAQNNPLSIRFRMDEKQFDVDGAYNTRYVIIKKRIDKALIKGTKERLTIRGKVAIAYADGKEREEYLEFIDYLQQQGYVTDAIEDLELEELPGAQGFRALRVTVKLEEKVEKRPVKKQKRRQKITEAA